MTNKLILHIPHASNIIPDKTGYTIDDATLNKEVMLLTDWHTDDLFSTLDNIAVIAEFNRVFCDVERFADDEQEVMSAAGMGVLYTKRDDGSQLRTVSAELKTAILNDYYYPHHERLNDVVAEQLNTTGHAFIIDCHSFSNKPFQRDLSQSVPRPDFCIGTDDYHTPRGLYKYAAVFLKWHGFTVKINTPYSGSIVPTDYYLKNKKVYSMMLEVNRDLYLLPGTNEKSENYDKIKLLLHGLLDSLARLDFKINVPVLKMRNQINDTNERI